jgi:AcrR family transcriptional regulator
MSAQDEESRPQRLSRKEAKARTRALLLDAGATVFARKGYAGASVDDVAETAGFSIGALYSNFGGKEELFLELLANRSSGRLAEATAIIVDASVPIEKRRLTLARHLVEVADQDLDLAVLQEEFWLYAVRRPGLQEELASQFRRNRDSLAAVLSDWARDHARPDDIPVDELATVLLALFQGLVQLRRTDPALVPDELYATAVRWLFAGITSIFGRTG